MAQVTSTQISIGGVKLGDVWIRKYSHVEGDIPSFVNLRIGNSFQQDISITFATMEDWENFRQAVVDNEVVVS